MPSRHGNGCAASEQVVSNEADNESLLAYCAGTLSYLTLFLCSEVNPDLWVFCFEIKLGDTYVSSLHNS